MRGMLKRIGWELWLPVVVIVAWWVLSSGSESFYFPPLSKIYQSFHHDWLFAHVSTDLLPSLRRLLAGFFLGTALGIVVGLVLGVVRPLEVAVSPITEFFRAMPSAAILPIMVLLFGLGVEMKVAIIAFVTFFPVLLNTIDGVRSLDPLLGDVAKGYRIRFLDRMLYMYLPAASPQVFAGARIAVSMSVIAMTVSEMVGTPGGMGYFVLDAQRGYAISSMWSGIIALGILGYALNKLFLLIESRVLSWHRGMTAPQG